MSNKETTHSVEETIELGRTFAKRLQAGDVVCLSGELGSGKTHFVKGIAEGLGIDQNDIHSPTFALIHEHSGSLPLYHFDFYRLESEKEALEIGVEEYFYGEGVSVIEWPDHFFSIIPEGALRIRIKSGGEQKRTFIFGNNKYEEA